MSGLTSCILVVEESEIGRTGLKALIEQSRPGDTVYAIGDAPQSVESAVTLNPGLVLMDMQLPNLAGLHAAKCIKDGFPAIRILMMTSTPSQEGLLTAFQFGADGYCMKGNPAVLLSSAISSVLEGALWIDPRLRDDVAEFIRSGGTSENWSESARVRAPILSQRELEVLRLLVRGLSNKEMADKLGVATETIKTHLRHVMEKLSVSDRTQAAIKALRMGLVEY